ncbi:MAG: hypothetical protein N4A70_17880 [Pelagimonas sp.]|jgi:hypothetical protein|nr:hypothetical protein [Pelagimonas sp.]
MKQIFGLIVAGALAGCVAPQADEVPRRTGDGVAKKLQPGSSKEVVDVALGLDAGFERNPEDWDQSCASYNYGSEASPKYVHALFRNGVLTRATDGHLVLCHFGEVAPGT